MEKYGFYFFCIFVIASLAYKMEIDKQEQAHKEEIKAKEVSEFKNGLIYIMAEKAKRKNR